MQQEKVDVLIIGAGPSGSVAAAYLHKQGLNVKVVEKGRFPRFVIGESLIPRCMDHFEAVGLLDCLKAMNFEVKDGARFINNKGVVCNFDFSKKHGDGWDWTWQVPRADFDKALTDELQSWGVDIAFEHEVTTVSFAEDGSSVTTVKDIDGNESSVQAKFIVDSSGFGRVLPRLLDLEKPSKIPQHSSIFTHVKDVNRPEGREGTMITFDVIDTHTWLWVIPFSNGYTSIGFVGKSEHLESLEGSNTEKLQQMMKLSSYYFDRFDGVDYTFEPRMIRNIAKSVKQLYGNGFVLTGNSAEFLDPVFSSGVTFAVESAHLAGQLIARSIKGEEVDWQTEYTDYMLEGVDVFSTYVAEWYTGNLQTIFFHNKENETIKEQICAVLAGYVWDKSNPFVKNHNRLVKTVAHIAKMEEQTSEEHS
ncbi:NAD(P)/FAD-dependent oxidoreductase [Zobellia galactanivorans]|uniref:Aromatic-ring hydroxylase, FAD-dependent oxidoreductase family n=1 Tax=Zobellia galactanivorans (strain DSM 12802 / CCUG 47099 / CIP 106680 / NCIMB 13871 / Dsij) TaxID=63186 RepID=G0LBK3_ZOBGA|nr:MULTISPECIES: NAD(P)/FAD-dependent oxidoreductase [Zobellia]MDO6810066.1 NAD(P)/FAD-dependent oxidoreductase [Zobellia galactanivorans]OWW27477.1 pyridine nucleotide-disulfide oxidoreductase [Zobellia sp. OII3]CAZ96240.1 Aromatic-ring hydroxylase, FAD-dependent oxidoreductase family [Zobellia galactanivorans]